MFEDDALFAHGWLQKIVDETLPQAEALAQARERFEAQRTSAQVEQHDEGLLSASSVWQWLGWDESHDREDWRESPRGAPPPRPDARASIAVRYQLDGPALAMPPDLRSPRDASAAVSTSKEADAVETSDLPSVHRTITWIKLFYPDFLEQWSSEDVALVAGTAGVATAGGMLVFAVLWGVRCRGRPILGCHQEELRAGEAALCTVGISWRSIGSGPLREDVPRGGTPGMSISAWDWALAPGAVRARAAGADGSSRRLRASQCPLGWGSRSCSAQCWRWQADVWCFGLGVTPTRAFRSSGDEGGAIRDSWASCSCPRAMPSCVAMLLASACSAGLIVLAILGAGKAFWLPQPWHSPGVHDFPIGCCIVATLFPKQSAREIAWEMRQYWVAEADFSDFAMPNAAIAHHPEKLRLIAVPHLAQHIGFVSTQPGMVAAPDSNSAPPSTQTDSPSPTTAAAHADVQVDAGDWQPPPVDDVLREVLQRTARTVAPLPPGSGAREIDEWALQFLDRSSWSVRPFGFDYGFSPFFAASERSVEEGSTTTADESGSLRGS